MKKIPFIISLLVLLFIGFISAETNFSYVSPTPAEEAILNQTFVEINVSLQEDEVSTNCILYLIYENKTKKLVMERNDSTCYYKYNDLINNTNYTAYITVVDNNEQIIKNEETHFTTDYGELPCYFGDVYGIRNCAINWLEGALDSILVTVLLICALIILVDYLKNREGVQ
jgi:ABC-type xylose transport system permease subunit